MRAWISILLTLALAPRLPAAGTQTWEMNTYADFLKGKFDGVSLTREGRLRLAPKIESIFTSDQPAIWTVVRAADGTLYLGTGHRGRVYRVSPSGESSIVWTADEPEVFALALDAQGRLYAATSPKGKVYRLEDGKAEEYFDPGTTYIWSLAFDKAGALYVGTGDEGKIFRVEEAGKGELYYDTGQIHVTALAFDAQGRLVAGTEPNGILYRISAKDKAFVLYDANLPEIRALAPMEDGSLYAAAMGGSVSRRAAVATTMAGKAATQAVAHTSITVSASQGGVEIQPQAKQAKPAAPKPMVTVPAVPVVEISGVEKSAVYRIYPDNTVEKLWSSKEENAYDLLVKDGRLLFTTDEKGRLYQLEDRDKATLLVQTNEEEAIRLLEGSDGLLVATGNMGKIYRVAGEPAPEGVYEAPVHDASRVARWGKLSWRAELPEGTELVFETRSGNSARPDATWSEWAGPLRDPEGSQVTSPNARFIQWRARFRSADGRTPELESVTLAYLPQNMAPKVTSITVASKASTAKQPKAATSTTQTSPTAAYSITVTASGESGASTVTGTATQKLPKAASEQIQITWRTEDLDGDKLVYALYFRGEGEREWKKIRDGIEETKYTLDSDALADGKYYFRVVASDAPSNPAASAREGERVSAPVLIDQTPPALTASVPEREGPRVRFTVEARDQASPLRRCQYSVDAGPWTPLEAEDGIIDSKVERFEVALDGLGPGEHLIVVRAYDAAGNAGLVKVVVR